MAFSHSAEDLVTPEQSIVTLQALGYTVDVYAPDDGPAIYSVRGFGIASTLTDTGALAKFSDAKAHGARRLQHERASSPRGVGLDGV